MNENYWTVFGTFAVIAILVFVAVRAWLRSVREMASFELTIMPGRNISCSVCGEKFGSVDEYAAAEHVCPGGDSNV